MLLFGVVSLWLVAVGLTWAGIAPLLPDNAIPEAAPAAFCVVLLLVAWFWARPKVPLRSQSATAEAYWQDPRAGAAGTLLIFMLEGPSTLAAVWTMVSGSWLTALVSLLGIVGIAVSGPSHQEQRSREHP
jgi:FtsH-binding integral membrane protein